jgi:hypothetical protein
MGGLTQARGRNAPDAPQRRIALTGPAHQGPFISLYNNNLQDTPKSPLEVHESGLSVLSERGKVHATGRSGGFPVQGAANPLESAIDPAARGSSTVFRRDSK